MVLKKSDGKFVNITPPKVVRNAQDGCEITEITFDDVIPTTSKKYNESSDKFIIKKTPGILKKSDGKILNITPPKDIPEVSEITEIVVDDDDVTPATSQQNEKCVET